MTHRNFLKNLAFVTLPLVALTLILSNTVPGFPPYAPVMWMSIIFFTLFSLTVHLLGTKAAASDNKNDFIRFIMMVIMGKLFLSVILVIGYIYAVQPSNRLVVLPFIPIYIIYTIFETKFMMRLAKS